MNQQLQIGGAKNKSHWKRRYIYDGQGDGLPVTMTVSLYLHAYAAAEAPGSSGSAASGATTSDFGDIDPESVNADKPGGAQTGSYNGLREVQQEIPGTQFIYATTHAQVSSLGTIGGPGPAGSSLATSEVLWSDP